MMTIKAEEAVYELESKILEMEGVKTIQMCLNNQGHISLSLMVTTQNMQAWYWFSAVTWFASTLMNTH